MSGAAAAALPGVDDADGEEGRFEWEMETAGLTDDYARLEFSVGGFAVPVIPLSVTDDCISIAVPAELAPWLPPLLHPLADPATGMPSLDGAQVTLVLMRVAITAGVVMVPAQSASWVDDGRWPAATGLDAHPIEDVMDPPADGGQIQPREGMLPPTDMTATPGELNDALAGGLFEGPWSGLAYLQSRNRRGERLSAP